MATVLVVEDEPNQRTLYQIELEDAGYRVILASDGREALQKVREEMPDLVVLDIALPRMDGIETLWQLIGWHAGLPVILYSAYEDFQNDYRAWVADAYLVKSSDVGVLVSEIRRVLLSKKEEKSTGGARGEFRVEKQTGHHLWERGVPGTGRIRA